MTDEHRAARLTSILALFIIPFLFISCRQDQEPPTAEATVTKTESTTAPTTSVQETTQTPTADNTEIPTAETTAPSPTPSDVPLETDLEMPFNSPEYGVQAFLWWRPDLAQRDLNLVQSMDFGWVKQSFAWRDIEGIEKGKYDWWHPDQIVQATEDKDLNLLVRIDRQPFWSQGPNADLKNNTPPTDLGDFGDFCGVLADRYRGRIAAYQIWNEPNLSREWGDQPPDPAEYAALLKICYEAIKAADPEAIVVSAGLAPTGTGLPVAMPDTEFLQGMYDAGSADYFDVLGLNAPGYKAPPETSPEEAESNPDYGGGRWFAFRHVEDMREIMVANGDGDKQAAILELGWTTDQINPEYAWHAVSEEEQAEYLVRAYQYAEENWEPWIGLMVTIYIADPDWSPEENEQWWWAITYPDGSHRLAYDALSFMPKAN